MLFVSILQFLALGFSISSLWQDALMISPEEHGVTCNITSWWTRRKYNITARNLHVFWRWNTLDIRWDFEGHSDTQIWLSETYTRTYDYRCKYQPRNITWPPTPQPVLLEDTNPIPSSSNISTINPTIPSITNLSTSSINERTQHDSNSDQFTEETVSFEVPPSAQYHSPITQSSFLPSIFYPLPINNVLQRTDTFGQSTVEYANPFVSTHIYSEEEIGYPFYGENISNTTTPMPTPDPYEHGCDDLQIVMKTGKSYFSLLIIGTVFEGVAMILMIGPLCHLNSVKTRRLLKRIIIGLNTFAFMILLMAFAIWFAFFSTNINQVVEQESSVALSVCLLGTPVIGLSIVWLLISWILLGMATMSSCYLSNRPKSWYRFLSNRRNISGHHVQLLRGGDGSSLQYHGRIVEESSDEEDVGDYDRTDSDSRSSSDEAENERLGALVHRTPSSTSDGTNETYRTAESSIGTMVKGDTYPVSYSPLQ